MSLTQASIKISTTPKTEPINIVKKTESALLKQNDQQPSSIYKPLVTTMAKPK
jgi:hypothetical protein